MSNVGIGIIVILIILVPVFFQLIILNIVSKKRYEDLKDHLEKIENELKLIRKSKSE